MKTTEKALGTLVNVYEKMHGRPATRSSAVLLLLATLACLPLAPLLAAQTGQPAARVVLGHLENNATVAFMPAGKGEWGVEVSGESVPQLSQAKPAQIEIFQDEKYVRDLAAGYQSVEKQGSEVVAKAVVPDQGGVEFAVVDAGRLRVMSCRLTEA